MEGMRPRHFRSRQTPHLLMCSASFYSICNPHPSAFRIARRCWPLDTVHKKNGDRTGGMPIKGTDCFQRTLVVSQKRWLKTVCHSGSERSSTLSWQQTRLRAKHPYTENILILKINTVSKVHKGQPCTAHTLAPLEL